MPASKAQLTLARSLGVRESQINYKTCGYYVDIAFPRQKIAVEYDGWYWHKNTVKRDQARAAALVRCGWRVLVIRSNGHVPAAKEVWAKIRQLNKRTPVLIYDCRELSKK